MSSYNNNHYHPHEPPRYPFTHDNDDGINMNADQGSPDVSVSRVSEHYLNHPLEFPIRLFGRPSLSHLLASHARQFSPDLRSPLHSYPLFSTAPDEAEAEETEEEPFHPIAGSSPWLGSSRPSPPQPQPRAHTSSSSPNASPSLPRGVSPNYRGNPYLATNQSADIPDALNTALWVTNLPPDCTHAMLLSSVRGCGKVYATVINPPSPSPPNLTPTPNPTSTQQQHITSASKLVFFDVAGAQALLRRAREGRFAVAGYVPRVRHNRIRSAARPPGPQSRVLHVEGPDRVVNEPFLAAFFAARFAYETECVVPLGRLAGRARLEWRFGSYRCQAESARAWIAREKERACGVGGGGVGSGFGGGSGGSGYGAAGAGFRTLGLSAPGLHKNPGVLGCSDYMSPQELLLRHLQSQQLLQQQRYESQAELEERLAWQGVTADVRESIRLGFVSGKST
ncbi:hypothetical protein F4775DRAFT_600014 [Biscogniauxia sp. FL1348]|nr:hypothetical protein F4775DRAFT_600014 [Biscogniauxia sp. FL1348]